MPSRAKSSETQALSATGTSSRYFDLMRAPGHLVRRTQQIHLAVWNQIVSENITSVQFAILALLDRHPDIDQRTVGEFLSIDTSTLAEVCARLAERGLVERRRDVVDRRRYVLRLSGSSEQLLASITPLVKEVGDQLLAPLSSSEQATLMRLMRKIVTAHQMEPAAADA